MPTPASRPAPRRRQGRPPVVADARERILLEASKLFAQSGYESSSIGELAAAIGVSKPAIYHYFATKQDIYDAIILQALQGLTDAVVPAVNAQPDPLDKLRVFMTAHAAYLERNYWSFVAMLVGFSGMSPSYRDDAARLRDAYERLLRQILEQGAREGVFRPGQVVTSGRAVLSLLNWMARWFKPGHGSTAEQIALDYFELLSAGLCVRPATTS
ncbi:MAG: TetR family transcriptional regulator [Bordetella sp. SCN 67-23]|nr:TetR family transcriptional regulator [Burkholderiales bacterium]ODS67721.1 MAG: TetR family transcriptional regulator [Bordetella sp. SCN 67-23]ODU77278.1 MAG: TetR family transcriptional regulator [Bordetella sp. SCN 68-11]OJW94223.1 MAG: TetR family transcriptional regulator [Burkholderiales bacterium 67-32]